MGFINQLITGGHHPVQTKGHDLNGDLIFSCVPQARLLLAGCSTAFSRILRDTSAPINIGEG